MKIVEAMSNALKPKYLHTLLLLLLLCFGFDLFLFFAYNGWGGGHAWVVRVRCSHYGFPNYLFPLTTSTPLRPRRRNLAFGGVGSPKRFRV